MIELLGHPRSFQGYAYGLDYPTIAWRVRVGWLDGTEAVRLNKIMAELVGESPPADNQHDEAGIALLKSVGFWHGAVQRMFNIPVFGPSFVQLRREGGSAGGVRDGILALPCHDSNAAREVSLYLLMIVKTDSAHGKEGDAPTEAREGLVALTKRLRPVSLVGTNSLRFFEAAHRLGVPAQQLSDVCFCVGQGANSRQLISSITDDTPALGVMLTTDKAICASVLAKHCIPVPRHVPVRSEQGAVNAAAQLGYPLVVKPSKLENGRGVYAGLASEASLLRAYRAARKHATELLVEKHQRGKDYRFTVFQRSVIKVMHRQAAQLTGDGRSSVRELVSELQGTREHRSALTRTGIERLVLDEEALDLLDEQGLTPADVPDRGQVVLLRRKSNISAGGSHCLVPLDEVHPDNCELAVRCAAVLGLDLAGIDVIMPDAAASWLESGAAVLEVNSRPQLGYRDTPNLFCDILQRLLPVRGDIPVHLMIVREARQLPDLSALQNIARRLECNGIATPDGIWVNCQRRAASPGDGFHAARALLLDRDVDSAFSVMCCEEVLKFGLPAPNIMSVRFFPRETADRRTEAGRRCRAVQQLLTVHQRERARNRPAPLCHDT